MNLVRRIVSRWLQQIPSFGFAFPLQLPSAASDAIADVRQAWRLAPAYRGVTLISNDLGRLRFKVKGSGGSGGDLVNGTPNRWQSRYEWRRSLCAQALTFGNGYSFIARSRLGAAVELQPLDPTQCIPLVEGKRLVYLDAELGRLDPVDVFHLRAPSLDGFVGESPLALCKGALSLCLSTENTGRAIYSNGGSPKLALCNPNQMSIEAQQKVQNDWVQRHTGTDKVRVPAILAEGMKPERIGANPVDLALADARRLSVDDVARMLGLPRAYLAGEANVDRNERSGTARLYVESCLAHWAEAFASEVEAKLLAPGVEVIPQYDRFLRPSLSETMAALKVGVEAGFITRNEARDWLGLEGGGAELDTFIQALNMGNAGGTQGGAAVGEDSSLTAGAVE